MQKIGKWTLCFEDMSERFAKLKWQEIKMFRKLRVIWFLVIIHCYSQLQEQELKIFTVLKSAMVKLYLH